MTDRSHADPGTCDVAVPAARAGAGAGASGPATFRAHFPMLADTLYLASCGLGMRSSHLDAAMGRMLDAMTDMAPWHRFEEQSALARDRFAALVGAHPDQIALVPNVSIAAYQVASSMDWSHRPRLVTTASDSPALGQVWLGQRPYGALISRVEAAGAADYEGAIDLRTTLVSVPLVTCVDGVRPPLAEITRATHAFGARVFVDASEAVGVQPVDVVELDCDFLVADAGKYLLGLPGAAFLYARSTSPADVAPGLTGYSVGADLAPFDPPRPPADRPAGRYDAGLLAAPAVYAANAGLDLIGELDLVEVREYISALTAYATRLLREDGESVRTPDDPSRRGAHVAVPDPDPAALAGWLAGRRAVVSPHGDVVRLAFHYYNSTEDVDELRAHLREYRGIRGAPAGGR